MTNERPRTCHDPQGRRIAKKVNGVITEKYLWQGLTRLLAVYNGSNSLLTRFQYADGRMPVTMTKGSTTYNLGYDQVGSLRVITDASGNIVKQIEYDSFGNILTDSNPTFTVPFGFAGGLHDRDINLVRFGFRDYDPETGRWTAKDPIGFAGGDVNLWGYVQYDPINFNDPEGLFLLKQFANRTAKYTSGKFLTNIEPSGRRIITAGIGGAASGAVGGAIAGTPLLGVGAGPSAVAGSIIGFNGGFLVQTGLEAVGLGQAIEDLSSEVIHNFLDAMEGEEEKVKTPCN